MTSRKDPEIRRLLRPFKENFTAVEIPICSNMKDIETYIAGHMDELPHRNHHRHRCPRIGNLDQMFFGHGW